MLHILQVGGIGTEVILNRLLVTDINEDVVEDTKLGGLATGNEQPALQHILYQTNGFQAYRLATGIGSGDNEDMSLVVEVDIEGHNLTFVAEEEQGMTSVEPVDFGDAVDNRTPGMESEREARLGADEVDACQKPIGIDKGIQLGTYHVGKAGQYLLYLMSLGKLQLSQVVVEFHHLVGFEIGSLPCGGFVVDEA